MTALLLALLAGASLAVVRAPFRIATVVLVGVLFLVPGNLVLGGFPSSLPVFRVVLWAFTLGLLDRARRGEIDPGVLRPTRVQAALAVFVGVALVNGIALTSVDNPLADATLIWLSLVDQLVVLTAVLAAARALGAWDVARIVAGFAAVVGAIAFWEHFSEVSYARWWFVKAGKTTVRVAAEPLTPRGSAVRVRGPYQFALEFSWVAVMVLPLVTVTATRARRRIALLGPVILALALLWSYSRSAMLGLVVVAVVLVLSSRFDARTLGAVAAAAILAALVLLAVPAVRAPFDAADEDSAASRERRLAAITEDLVERPYTGLGLAGLRDRGIGGADASFTLVYAAMGVPGVLALAIAQATAAGTCVAALRDRRRRALSAAALAGVIGGVCGNFALDLVAVPGSGKSFWILAALGAAVASDRAACAGPGSSSDRARRLTPRLVVVGAALAVGSAVAATWPTHAASNYRFQTVERPELAQTRADVTFGGRFLVNTACELALLTSETLPDGKVDCLESRVGPGVGSLRIETDDPQTTALVAARIETAVRERLPGFTLHELRSAEGRPTPIHTMPMWLTGLAVAGVVLVPRRSRAGDPESPPPPPPSRPVVVRTRSAATRSSPGRAPDPGRGRSAEPLTCDRVGRQSRTPRAEGRRWTDGEGAGDE